MRTRPYAFLPVGDRWINMALVTDIEDRGTELRIFLVSDMARLSGGQEPSPIDVARRVTVSDPEMIEKVKRWLLLNDDD